MLIRMSVPRASEIANHHSGGLRIGEVTHRRAPQSEYLCIRRTRKIVGLKIVIKGMKESGK